MNLAICAKSETALRRIAPGYAAQRGAATPPAPFQASRVTRWLSWIKEMKIWGAAGIAGRTKAASASAD